MKPSAKRALIASLIGISMLSTAQSSAGQNSEIDRSKTLLAAREKYYNLRRLGLLDVHAALQPNWDVLLADTNAAEKAKTTLNKLRFWISIDAAGQFNLSHDAKAVLPNQLDQIENVFKDVNASVSGFFRTWSIFHLGSPFPDGESNFSIDRIAGGYRFAQRQGDLDVTTETDNEFAITEIRVVAADRTSSLKPVLQKTPTGFLLRGYRASSHRADGAETNVTVALEYETVNGLSMLQKVNLNTVVQGSAATFEWVLSDYQIKTR